MFLEYHSVVVLCFFFWFWWDIVFGVTYVLSVQYSCTGKKGLVVCLAGVQSLLRPELKSSSRLSGGCMIVIMTGKKGCLAGARCIEFECNEFVLVLVQIDLIHFEHSICISST